MDIIHWLEKMGINIGLLIAGYIGAFVAFTEKETDIKTKLISYLAGAFIANYIAPPFAEWIKLTESFKYGFAFVLGFAGIAGVKFLITWGKKKMNKTIDK